MYKTKLKITSSKGSLTGGKLYSEKQIREVLTKDEMEQQIEKGHIEILDIPVASPKVQSVSIEEFLDVEDKNSLTVGNLLKIVDHYKLEKRGKKADIVKGIEEFEALLDTEDLSTLTDDEVKAIARYYEVDETLEREQMIEAIENVA